MITFIQLTTTFLWARQISTEHLTFLYMHIFYLIHFIYANRYLLALSIWTTITLFYGGPVPHSRWCHFFVMMEAHLDNATYSNSCHFHTCFYERALKASKSRQNLGSKSCFFIIDIRPAVLVFSSDYITG